MMKTKSSHEDGACASGIQVKIYTELLELIPATVVCYMYSRWGRECVKCKEKKKEITHFHVSISPPETLRSLISTLGRPLH